MLPKHKKNAEIGEKKTVFTSSILVEQEDAISFDDQEEVTRDFGLVIPVLNFCIDHIDGLGQRYRAF